MTDLILGAGSVGFVTVAERAVAVVLAQGMSVSIVLALDDDAGKSGGGGGSCGGDDSCLVDRGDVGISTSMGVVIFSEITLDGLSVDFALADFILRCTLMTNSDPCASINFSILDFTLLFIAWIFRFEFISLSTI